jgi:hypothetical protein
MAITTNYSWSTPDNTSYVKDGASAIRTLGSSVDTTLFTALGGTYPGLRLIKKQTIGSGVTSVNVTSAFSSTYANYMIQIAGMDGSVNNAGVTMRFGTIASPVTTGYSFAGTFIPYTGTMGFVQQPTPGFWEAFCTNTDTNSQILFVNGPNLAGVTTYQAHIGRGDGTVNLAGIHNGTTQHVDFHITSTSGTLTGGSINVYGFGIS